MTTVETGGGLDSTQALVTRARDGDPVALETIVLRYRSGLMRFAHGRLPVAARGMVDTADMVQLAVIRTLERIDTFQPTFRGSLLAYLRRAVLNQIRDEIRRAERRPVTDELSPHLPHPGVGPLEQAIHRDVLERYEAALTDLPADQQEAFLMRIEMGCGYREIADALGRPSAESARMLVRRGIHNMARRLRAVRGA
jgi:RNA polymerase sigma-70 factor (ECF subfamily)